MKLYFSGIGGAQRFIIETILDLPIHRSLVSFYYKDQLDKLLSFSKDWSIFIDSGAYSAFNSGAKIDIDSYVDFSKDVDSFVDAIASLDVLGDPYASLSNYRYMLSHNVNVWPTYHFGEPREILDAYVETTDRICVGGVAGTGVTPVSISENLKYIYSVYPHLKIHVFGVNSFDALVNLPIYSVDALTWRSGSRFGDAFIRGRRYKVGRIATRNNVFLEAAEYLRSYGLDVTSEDVDWNKLDIYNIQALYQMLEVDHSGIDYSSIPTTQYLF